MLKVKPGIRVSQRAPKSVTSSESDLHNGETESGRGGQEGLLLSAGTVSQLKPPFMQVHAKSMHG